MTDQSTRTHQYCGKPMTATRFDHLNPTPQYRSQPIWVCDPCAEWEPREGWDGALPDAWNGTRWAR